MGRLFIHRRYLRDYLWILRQLSGRKGAEFREAPSRNIPGQVKIQNVTKQGVWNFDVDGDGNVDRCSIDQCIENFGQAGDLPIVGDWNGTGEEEIGFFRPQTQQWYLDLNGNGKWDGATVDKQLGPYGLSTDLPIVGDWDGTGKVRIGVYRPSTGQWFLDLNGNGKWDGSPLDRVVGPFGQVGDLPVVGNW